MEIEFAETAWEDLEFWKASGNKSVQKKLTALLSNMEESPFEGIGKPEALKHNHSGKWSRRINQEHRIIYELNEGKIYIFSLRGHYKD